MDATSTEAREQAAWNALSQVIDPELGLPVTDLGLVYRVEIDGSKVTVDMTTTTPVCPLGSFLTQMAESKLMEIDGIDRVSIRMVTEPRWSPEMMSDRARQILRIS